MQGGKKNWILPKRWEIWPNHFCPSMGPNGGSVAMDYVSTHDSSFLNLISTENNLRMHRMELRSRSGLNCTIIILKNLGKLTASGVLFVA